MEPDARMDRAIDTRGAVAINVITMVGIGPLITIPLVLSYLGGALALLGWIAGAVVALCDGLVWAELASRFPSSGGTYVYLREAFGRAGLGRALAFLFNWQFLLYAPCLLATGYIGFASYAAYLAPGLAAGTALHACAIGIGILTIALLLRRTARVSAMGLLFGGVAVLTLGLIASAALTHAAWHSIAQLPGNVRLGGGFLAGFGGALLLTLYDYVGYADVALLGDEVGEPRRTIPRSIIISVLLVALLYIALQCGVLGVIPWRSLFGPGGSPTAASQYVGSIVVQRTWGALAARVVTVLVLITAFASVYGNLLGFSRIPYAAARDRAFLPFFARLHPRKHIPQTALLVVGALSLVASLFTLEQVIQILTAGIVLIQSIAQILALVQLRTRGPAPFRMPLYPLPALVALAGWAWAFVASGSVAIALGLAWLSAGVLVYLVAARAQRAWPFAMISAALLGVFFLIPRSAVAQPAGAWQSWHTSRIVQLNGYPLFEVDGKPFFVWGAAFFYERIPADEWKASLQSYREFFHINTIDLYVPWNWEEPTEGHLDFHGRTNPRRNLLGLMRTIHRLGFKVVLRPGPVIRNEWRNGGYPAWLLERPAYDMPLHDVLDGRYPATATLQNQHADAAANEWLHNAVHLHYAANWLREVLSAVAPYSHDIIAIALDDDQGAYLDNDTWPAPHWRGYVAWLERQVRSTAGARVPVFINTYEQKVTADSPVWAWGDWYQSAAYRIGEHDRGDLDFSMDLLATQSRVPVMMAEFQAGWLQGADEGEPRPADPSNTALALGELLADGAHGVVDFPLQDTRYPAGWEVPWANWAYDWDAAVSDEPAYFHRRAVPTAFFGATVDRMGSAIAQTHTVADVAIVWPPDLFALAQSARAVEQDAAAVIRVLRACRERGLLCAIADLRYGATERFRYYLLPATTSLAANAYSNEAMHVLTRLAEQRRLVSSLATVRPSFLTGNHGEASLLLSDDGASAFIVVTNWGDAPLRAGPYGVRLDHRWKAVPAVLLGPRKTAVVAVGAPMVETGPRPVDHFTFGTAHSEYARSIPHHTAAYFMDVFRDGEPAVVLASSSSFLILDPAAGARIAALRARGPNFASTIGLLRDAVDPEPTPSARDYIAAFTHPIPAGTFNRQYHCALAHVERSAARLTCSYEAPDTPSGGAEFERSLTFDPTSGEVRITESMTPRDPASDAHLQSISGFAFAPGERLLTSRSCFGIYDPRSRDLARLCWNRSDVATDDIRRTRGAAILTLHFGTNHVALRLGILEVNATSVTRSGREAFPPPHRRRRGRCTGSRC